MIYSVKAEKADYDQYSEVIVVANSEKEAHELARKEFESAKNWYAPWKDQKYTISKINTKSSHVVAAIMVW